MSGKKISRITLAVIGVFLVLLLAGRLYLPYWATNYVNRQINALKGYGGGIDDIDIALWRGAYVIHGLDIYKTQGRLKTPFVAADTIDLSIQWKALLHGAVVAEIEASDIAVNFAKSQTGEGAGWGRLVDALSPFDINRIAVDGGKIRYIDPAASPPIDIALEDISASITNLRNVESRRVTLPSDVAVKGTSMGGGKLDIAGRMNILQDQPDFDVDAKFENADLTAFNDYTRNAAAVDFKKGSFSVYSELAGVDGRVTGYVKPVLRDVTVLDLRRQDSNPINALWETMVAGFMTIFKNHGQDQFALRIPVEGRIDSAETDMWSGFFSIFSNAFVKAFPRNTDGTVNLQDALTQQKEAADGK